ncbi:MAG: apolipoprotein N-acyltransferase [Ignavibacteriales bacterium]|nr:apolipoprotein N-acyltransferase [Ignavibacteriales bacterium]
MKLFKFDFQKLNKKNISLAILSGILIGISFPPIPLPILIFFSFVPFFFLLEIKNTLGEINRISYLTFFVFNLITLYWVGSWTKEADPFLMISGVLLLFLNPAFYLIPTSIYFLSTKIISKEKSLLLFPIFWVFFEYIYSVTDLRFPWLTLGNSLPYFNQFIQIADVIGAYGLSLLILYINIFIYLSIKELRTTKKINYKYALIATLLFIIPIIYGSVKIANQKPFVNKVTVGLIQPNLNPWDKWSGGNLDQQIDLYLDLSEKAYKQGARLIIWPESALSVYLLSGNYSEQVQKIQKFVYMNNIFLMTGMPDVNFYFDLNNAPNDAKKLKSGDAAYTSYNSILLFSPITLEVQKYQKNLLVPFGEHVPFVEHFPFLGNLIRWQVGISSWNVGKEQNVFDLSSIKVGGIICIESIYPDYVAKFVQKGADFIAVVTNDSWYGYSSGPFQHKEISVLRAIENRRSVVRAANGGISCVIDPFGRTLKKTNLFEKTILVASVPIYSEKTFYTKYPLLIPYFVVLVTLIVLISVLIFSLKIKIRKKHD